MNDESHLDKTLVQAYRQQVAPNELRHKIVAQFSAPAHRQNPWLGWRAGALASVVVSLIVTAMLSNQRAITPSRTGSSISLNVSTAPIQPLPSLSSFSLGTSYATTSISHAKPAGFTDLTGQYRRTINLTNEIL